jgi:hypothetical protein
MRRFRRNRRQHSDGEGRGGGAGRAARRGAWGLARVITTIAALVAGVIVLGIVLVVLEANRSNGLVELILDVARFLVGPFKDMFDLDDRKVEVAVNWGIAAAVYLIVASVIAKLLRRG